MQREDIFEPADSQRVLFHEIEERLEFPACDNLLIRVPGDAARTGRAARRHDQTLTDRAGRAFTLFEGFSASPFSLDADAEREQKRRRVDRGNGGNGEHGDGAQSRTHAKQEQRAKCGQHGDRLDDASRVDTHGGYFSRTRDPRIFWLLNALRKLGTSRSISSKYDDKAGVFCCAL